MGNKATMRMSLMMLDEVFAEVIGHSKREIAGQELVTTF